jgi:catechol 2,3-dioxygenase-like lactoylglutathione lyase family enzyme
MVRNFDHVTIVVRDVEAAKRFFAFLGFKEVKSVVISGKVMEDYMGVKGVEAEHVTLAIENPHTFAVDDLEAEMPAFIRPSERMSRGTVTGRRNSRTRLRVSCHPSRTSEHSSVGAAKKT